MGLLGDGWNDPQSAANMAMAGNLVRGGLNGGFGGGLLAAGDAYQQAQNGALGRQLTQAQIGEIAMKNQMEQYQLKRLQDWDRLVNGDQTQTAPQTTALGAGAGMPAIPPTAGGALGSGTFGIASGGQQATAQPQPQPQSGFRFGLRGIPDAGSRAVAASMNPSDYMKLYATQNAPQTDIEKLMAAQGIAPDSALGRQILQQALAKANYTAPVNARPGSILRDPYTNKPIAYNPHIPDGSMPLFDASGNVTQIQPINGAYPAMAASAAATEFGKAEATPTVAYDASGTPVFSTKANDVRRAGGGLPGAPAAPPPNVPAQPGVNGNFGGDPAQIATIIGNIKDPQERANAMAALEEQVRRNGAGPLTPQQRPGVVQGATLSQDELSKKGSALMADNGQTNTVISRLQNIKMLAPGAITGAESSRRDFFNGLLSLADIQPAKDAKTASDLVDKNASQIVSALRMGQGGAGTDALQTLIGAANPNRHMTKEAIMEAADQLIASQKMVQAKAQILQPHYVGRDPVQYGQKELAFDQNADPRVWQLEAMPPQQQAAYVQSLPPTVAADLLKKRKALRAIGAIK